MQVISFYAQTNKTGDSINVQDVAEFNRQIQRGDIRQSGEYEDKTKGTPSKIHLPGYVALSFVRTAIEKGVGATSCMIHSFWYAVVIILRHLSVRAERLHPRIRFDALLVCLITLQIATITAIFTN
ncbi:hypothetical protein TNCV_4118091 [Trichonephila clavipes]|nr:hypothetical protein TNCV_4118091 [Trichonephila clavipes]